MLKDRKRKRRPWIDSVLVGAIFSLTVLIGFIIFTTGDSKFQSTTAVEKNSGTQLGQQSTLTETPTPFTDIHLITESSNDDSIPYSLQYPKTKFDIANEKVKQYITNSKTEYFNAIRPYRNAQSTENSVGDFRISVDIYQSTPNYYSFVFTNKSSIDRTTYDTTIQTYILNSQTGEFVSTYELLDKKIENLEVFAKYVREQLTIVYKDSLYKDKMVTLTEPKWRLFNRLAIIDEKLVVYYDKNEIVDPLAGMPTVQIPLSYLNPILAKPFRTQTISEDTIIPVKKGTGKRVALTFDDGPHEKITKQILTSLDKYDAKATFFMMGHRVGKNTKLVKEIYNNGHEIGNHTWNHPKLTDISSSQVLSQINSTNNAIYKVIGENPTVFRPPYGAKNSRVTSLIDVPVIMWTIDTLDWKYRNKDKLLPVIKNNLHNDAIILMHDIHQSTADGLDSVLAYLNEEGYECVTVSELLASN